MKQRIQGIVIGLLLGSLVFFGSTAIALTGTRTLEATYHDIRLVINGDEVIPRDANGNIVEPFIINGTTYMPIRAVATAFGLETYWDGPNWTAYLGKMGGNLVNPTLKWGDAVHIGSPIGRTRTLTDNYGNVYTEAYALQHYAGEDTYQVLLNMRYSRFRATIFVESGETDPGSASVIITADGNTIFEAPTITKTSNPIFVDIDVTGCNDFKIFVSHFGWAPPEIYIANAGFYQ